VILVEIACYFFCLGWLAVACRPKPHKPETKSDRHE